MTLNYRPRKRQKRRCACQSVYLALPTGLTAQSSQQLALPKYAASPHKFQPPPEWNVTTFTGQTPYTARQGLSSLLRVLPLSLFASCLAVATGSHSLPPTQVTKFLFSFLTSVMPSAEGPPFKDLRLASPEDSFTLHEFICSPQDSLAELVCPVMLP